MLDRKGIAWFLIITFGMTYAIEFGMIAAGVRISGVTRVYGQLLVLAAMWVPALATVIVIKWITKEGFASTGLRVGPIKPYLIWMALMPVVFAIIYGLTWLLGIARPDWQLSAFLQMMSDQGTDLSTAPPTGVILAGLFIGAAVTGPFLNGLFAFGEELGWRGYLLPKLMPLGKVWAYLISGVIWGLWHLPLLLIGFTYPGANTLLAVIAFVAATTAIGIFVSELSLRHRSSILAGWLHGVLNSQRFSIWPLVFPEFNPLLGGWAGVIGIVVWAAVGVIVIIRKPAKSERLRAKS